jgi:uncharacterized protein YecT (DUF1311 family)
MLAIALAAMLAGTPQSGAFAYTMEVTPEEGPLDPAIERRYTPQFQACQERATVTSENANCFEAEFARQDAVLNRIWRTTLARLPANQHQPLRAAQRKWITARDRFCKSDVEGFDNGTIAPVAYSDCRVELTIRRTMWLERLK